RPRRSTGSRSGDPRARRLLPVRHRRPLVGGRTLVVRPAPRGGKGGGDRRGGGGGLPRVAGLPRGRSGDRIAAGVGRGDPGRRACPRARSAPAVGSARRGGAVHATT